jgi:hypothetical protein
MWRNLSSSLFLGTVAALGASRASAAAPPCSPIAVAADAGVRARWPGLPLQLREAFEGRSDIDACARIELTMGEGSIAVAVTLPDGRSAVRQVPRREDVLPTLEALLLVPRPAASGLGVEASAPSPQEPAAPPAIEAVAVAPASVHGAVPERDHVEATRASDAPGRLRIELSVLTDARIGDGQKSVGLGALSLLEASGWLVGFEGRAERQEIAGEYSGAALELAALGGRRFRFQGLALDLVGGPAAALQGGGRDTTVTPGGSTSSKSGPGTAERALIEAHLIFGARSSFRTFIGVDGEVGPASPGANPSGEPRLPVWTAGLTLGATVGTR